MEYKELAIEFTETNYLTRSEIMDYYGYLYNEDIWWEVCRYRRNFSLVLPLQCSENSNVFVITYAKMLLELDNLSRDVIRIMNYFNNVKFDKHFFYDHKNYFVKKIFEEILALLKVYEVNITLNTLILLVNGKKRPSNKEERFSKNLFMMFYRLVFTKEEKIMVNKEQIEKIGHQLGAKEFFRTERWFLDMNNTIEAGFEPGSLSIKFNQLLQFIHRKSKLHPLIKATAVFYYFKLGIMVNMNLDLIAIYLFLYTLKISGMPQLVLTISFIKTIIKKAKKFDEAYYNCAESNNDITYLVNLFLDVFNGGIKELKNEFETNEKLAKYFQNKNNKKNQQLQNQLLVTTKHDRSIKEIQSLGLHNKEQLFLETIKNQNRQQYTLDDFRKITNASYEKARYSMNSFAKQGLFIKTKKGKKFVYKVVQKNSKE